MLERLTQTDHAAAVQIVQRYLNADQLQALLDKHVQHIVSLTEQAHGRSSPYVGADLAAFLIDLHGIDLLQNRLIRVYLTHSLPADQIAHLANWGGEVVPPTLFLQVKQIANRRWVSGKQWPRHFAQAFGFPNIFAGLVGNPLGPSMEEVDSPVPLRAMHDYQRELVGKIHVVNYGIELRRFTV